MAIPKVEKILTVAEYLKIERAAEFRSEYFDGEMFAMSGGTPQHSLVKTNLVSELRDALMDRTCTAYDSDLRIRVSATGLYTYPGASVFCEPMEFLDDQKDVALNPTLLVEVLSPSTEAYDRGKKFEHYRSIAALREYVLVSQEEATVERFLRNADGTWTLTAVSGRDQSLYLPSIDVTLPLAGLYKKVIFPAKRAEGEVQPS